MWSCSVVAIVMCKNLVNIVYCGRAQEDRNPCRDMDIYSQELYRRGRSRCASWGLVVASCMVARHALQMAVRPVRDTESRMRQSSISSHPKDAGE